MDERLDLRPTIAQWLTLRKNLANKSGSKMEFVYKNALKSLQSTTEPVYSAKDCIRIKYFGDKLCSQIAEMIKETGKSDTSAEEDNEASGVAVATKAHKKKSKSVDTQNERRKKRSYFPKKGSGGYALLIALLIAERDQDREELNKEELMQSAQPFADESMTKPRPGSHYTAFSSMKTLISNQLVLRHQSRNSFYRLTETGRDLAQKLVSYAEDKKPCNLSDNDDTDSVLLPSSFHHEPHVLYPGTFEIVLLVDTREQCSGVDQSLKKTAIISELLKKGVQAEMRTLPVGDFAWVARRIQSASGPLQHAPELLMDFVIERKKADDLASSIVDGRFREQKHRLLKCGVRKPTYLVEGLVRGDYNVPYRNLLQAVTNSQVVDGFDIKTTLNHPETIAYLSGMTKQLNRRLSSKSLFSCSHRQTQDKDFKLPDDHFMTFSEFEKGSKKITNFTVSEMFLKHLIQFSGATVVKAKAITDEYKTLNDLMDAYDDCLTEKQKEKLLASLKHGLKLRSVGPVLSGKIFKYYFYSGVRSA